MFWASFAFMWPFQIDWIKTQYRVLCDISEGSFAFVRLHKLHHFHYVCGFFFSSYPILSKIFLLYLAETHTKSLRAGSPVDIWSYPYK